MSFKRSIAPLATSLLASAAAFAGGYAGDLGPGIYSRQGTYHGESTQTDVLPYVYGQWGHLFGRVDTFGYQVLPFGHGALEVSTRILQDAMDSDSLKQAGVRGRSNSRLLGLSTLQITPVGAFKLSFMQDFGHSKGQVADGSWLGRYQPNGWLTIYPELGVEVLSAKYTDYYFGTNAGEGGYAGYKAGMAFNPYAALHTSSPLGGNWNLALMLRYKKLDSEIADSPIVARSSRVNGYVAVSYEFK